MFSRYAVPQIFLVLLGLTALAGCLSDPTEPQVFYRGIFKPSTIARHDSNYNVGSNTGDLIVNWGRSPSDTQSNFKGYHIKLYHSVIDTAFGQGLIDSLIYPAVDSEHVAPFVHQYVFHGLKLGRYTTQIWGERFPDPAKPDSLALSFDYDYLSFDFDPRPVQNPKNLRAVAEGPNSVKLQWDLPACDTQSNFLQYAIFARKAFQKDSGRFVQAASAHISSAIVPAPKGIDAFNEASYIFWIKAIRKDSLSSNTDSSTVTWSGAELLPPATDSSGAVTVVSGNGIFVGQTNAGYALLSVRNDSSMIQVQIMNGQATLSAGGAAGASGIVRFVTGTDDAPKLDSIFYSLPHALTDYSASTLTLPISSSSGGVVVYALIPSPSGTAIVRIFFKKDQTSGALLDGSNALHVRASYQPDPALLYY